MVLNAFAIFIILALSAARGYAPLKQSKTLHQSKLDFALQGRSIFRTAGKSVVSADVTKKTVNPFSEEYLKSINLPNSLTIARVFSVPLFAAAFSLRLVSPPQ